eukprot:scaffold195331_cov36-Prasinocladus_malaysianus.AAC.1
MRCCREACMSLISVATFAGANKGPHQESFSRRSSPTPLDQAALPGVQAVCLQYAVMIDAGCVCDVCVRSYQTRSVRRLLGRHSLKAVPQGCTQRRRPLPGATRKTPKERRSMASLTMTGRARRSFWGLRRVMQYVALA